MLRPDVANATQWELAGEVYTVAITLNGPNEGAAIGLLKFFLDVLTRYFWLFIATIGLPGNVLSFFICLTKDNRQFSTCIYMAALAIVDSVHLITITVAFISMFWSVEGITEFQLQWIYYWGYSMAILSGLYLAMMSIDRLVVVRFPLAAKQKCTTSRALRVVAVSAFAIMGINSHIFFAFRKEGDNNTFIKVVIKGYPALETLVNTFHLICGSVAPFLVIVVCNFWIIITLRNASKKRTEMGVGKEVAKSQGKETRHLTRMLIFVCIAYVVTSLPYRLHDLVLAIPQLAEMYNFKDEYWNLRYTTQYYVILSIWHWNYGINFYLYCIGGGRKYRGDVKKLFQCKNVKDIS